MATIVDWFVADRKGFLQKPKRYPPNVAARNEMAKGPTKCCSRALGVEVFPGVLMV
jgi:hypothetical protein